MTSVVGKFALKSLETHRSFDGPGAAAHIKLEAVQSESWGKYTPSGSVDMYITKPTAAKVFIDAWNRTLESTEPVVDWPQFYVRFTPAEEVDSGQREA